MAAGIATRHRSLLRAAAAIPHPSHALGRKVVLQLHVERGPCAVPFPDLPLLPASIVSAHRHLRDPPALLPGIPAVAARHRAHLPPPAYHRIQRDLPKAAATRTSPDPHPGD